MSGGLSIGERLNTPLVQVVIIDHLTKYLIPRFLVRFEEEKA